MSRRGTGSVRAGRARPVGHVEDHLAWCRLRSLRGATINARRNSLRRTERALGVPLAQATAEQITIWWKSLECTLGDTGRAGELSHARMFFRWLQLEELREDDPTVKLIRPRLRRRLPRPMPEDELQIALAAASGRVRPWLLLAAYCGLRAGEIATLHGDDLMDNEAGSALIVREGKGGKQRILPVPAAIRAALEPWPHDWIAARRDGLAGHLSAGRVSGYANEELHALGITYTLHTLRHRYLTQLYGLTLDLRLVQEMAGHASPVTTAGYAAWSPAKAREAVELLPMGAAL